MKIIRMTFVFFSVSVVLLTSCSRLYPQRGRAYIVSIGLDYEKTDLPHLRGTTDDARETANCLRAVYDSKGIENTVFLFTDCTAQSVMSLLGALEFTKNDFLVFYWSGHGHSDEGGVFLVAYSDNGAPYSRLYLDDLLGFTESLPCPSVLILDSCYSGDAVREKAFHMIDGLSLSKSAVIASCERDELSVISYVRTQEGPVQAHSLFTIALLEELGWKHSLDNPEGGFLCSVPQRLTVSDLGEKIRISLGDSVQHPVFGRTDIPVCILP